MTLMRFDLAADTLQFECGSEFPTTNREEITQVFDRSAGGSLHVESLGVNIKQRILAFTLMPLVDYNGLVNWYYNVANGAMKVFSFTDEYGVVADVRIISESINFVEAYLDTYSGTLTIEYV